jgi:hypothetical protein
VPEVVFELICVMLRAGFECSWVVVGKRVNCSVILTVYNP